VLPAHVIARVSNAWHGLRCTTRPCLGMPQALSHHCPCLHPLYPTHTHIPYRNRHAPPTSPPHTHGKALVARPDHAQECHKPCQTHSTLCTLCSLSQPPSTMYTINSHKKYGLQTHPDLPERPGLVVGTASASNLVMWLHPCTLSSPASVHVCLPQLCSQVSCGVWLVVAVTHDVCLRSGARNTSGQQAVPAVSHLQQPRTQSALPGYTECIVQCSM
jgi:hypothetical protein